VGSLYHFYFIDADDLVLFRADFLVALDACFTQKRGKNLNNPSHQDCPRHHLSPHFSLRKRLKQWKSM